MARHLIHPQIVAVVTAALNHMAEEEGLTFQVSDIRPEPALPDAPARSHWARAGVLTATMDRFQFTRRRTR